MSDVFVFACHFEITKLSAKVNHLVFGVEASFDPFYVGLPDVRQKEDMSSFLKSCPPSGRHWLYMENVRLFSVTDLPTLLVAMARYHLYCVYRFNCKLSQMNSSHKVQSEETVLRRVS